MPIVVVDSQGSAYYERDFKGASIAPWQWVELLHYLKHNWPQGPSGRRRALPIMLVCHNPHKVFIEAHEVFKNDPDWQVRLNATQSDANTRVNSLDNLHVKLFGFRDDNRHTRYFHPICPLDFMHTFDKYGDPRYPEYVRLYEWAGHVRKWIQKNKLRYAQTRGGLAAQLLRDPKFYSQARRKVPKLTNERARDALPGNFYAATLEKKMWSRVYVIDQENAHHYAARTVNLPSANDLFAKGRYRELSDSPFARPGSTPYERIMSEYGLLRLRVFVPRGLKGTIPQWASKRELVNIYAYSNEIPLLESLGIEIRHISYAWTSEGTDQGLARYAEWAEQEVRRNEPQRAWLKPTLLSAYGILGARPRILESAFWNSEKGEPTPYIFGAYADTFKRIRTQREVQSPIANVIHRGMIEAETRRLSITLARQLEAEGHTVIAVHADALIVNDEGQQLPLLPPPWRVKDQLSQFKVLDKVSFESESLTILPGRKRAKV